MIKSRLLYFSLCCLVTFNLGITIPSYANHAVGAELTYECLGGNQYRLTYAFYRDCASIAAPSSVLVSYSSSCSATFNVNLTPVAGTPNQISAVCPSVQTTCNGGSYTGVEEWIYDGIVSLPVSCSNWVFSTAVCCRNAAITTVNNVTTYQLYTFALLNNSDGSCNNSPHFINRPLLNACVGQSICFNNGVYDIDGDSVTYQIITPLAAAGNSIQYNFPYSSTQPVLSNPTVSFNPVTGDLCMTPTQPDISPYGLLVSEFRNGVLIGQVERDIQIEVQSCNNQLPYLSGFDGGPSHNRNVCPGVNSTFYIKSFDVDAVDQTEISWDSGIPSAQFYTSGGHRDSASISWTPMTSDTSDNPHCFTVTVKDDHCPYILSRIYNYCLTVLPASDAACLPNSIEEKSSPPELKIYQQGYTYRIEWEDSKKFNCARIFDSSGRIIQRIYVDGKQELSFNTESIQSGLYQICLDGKEYSCKSFFRE